MYRGSKTALPEKKSLGEPKIFRKAWKTKKTQGAIRFDKRDERVRIQRAAESGGPIREAPVFSMLAKIKDCPRNGSPDPTISESGLNLFCWHRAHKGMEQRVR